MASAGSDDEQQPQPKKCCLGCIPWKSDSRNPAVSDEEEPQPQPEQEPRLHNSPADQDTRGPEEPRRQETPAAHEEKSRGSEETPRRVTLGALFQSDPRLPEFERDVEFDPEQLNTNLQSSKPKDKEKVDEVAASDSSSDEVKISGPGEPSLSDAIPGVEVDIHRVCTVCGRTTGFRDTNDIRLLKWSDVCNHLVCDECIAETLNSRNPGAPDAHPVECPVEGCTQVRTAGQCRASYRAAFRRMFA